MEDDHLPVRGELDIQLHPVAFFRRGPEGGEGIFRDAVMIVIQAPVGIEETAEIRRGILSHLSHPPQRLPGRKHWQLSGF